MMILANRLKTLADIDRLRILGLCARADLTLCELAEILDLPRKRVERHIAVLVAANLVSCNGQCPRSSYHLSGRPEDGGLLESLVDLIPHDRGCHYRDLRRLTAKRSADPRYGRMEWRAPAQRQPGNR
ncbi:MAG: winged helix-turn-helix transcriptional regulator [Mesorhizobium sp.]|nr:MAG: winged helix-turn-helix transcriptional regulator [Mesorhizobium sp.]